MRHYATGVATDDAFDLELPDYVELRAEIDLRLINWVAARGWFATPARTEELRRMPYADYLRSPEWRRRAMLAKQLAGFSCRMCGRNAIDEAITLHVHHPNYEDRGSELPNDLVVLCGRCHKRHHGIK